MNNFMIDNNKMDKMNMDDFNALYEKAKANSDMDINKINRIKETNELIKNIEKTLNLIKENFYSSLGDKSKENEKIIKETNELIKVTEKEHNRTKEYFYNLLKDTIKLKTKD